MIKLSERLQTIADYIEDKEDIADIGTDHGYLPLYLLDINGDRKAIFTDVNKGPLVKAQNMILKEHPDSQISDYDLRLGDGLEPLTGGEVDVIIIAGMGGILISEILAANPDKTGSYKKFILQPRTASEKLRKWLIENDMYIYDEKLVYENGKICEIIAVDTQTDKRNKEFKDELDFEFSPVLISGNDAITRDWLNRLLSTEIKIKESIESSGTSESLKKLDSINNRIKKLMSILADLKQEG